MSKLRFSILPTNEVKVVESQHHDLYSYRVYTGPQKIETSKFNSYWYIKDDTVISMSGTGEAIDSSKVCVEIFGYTPETRTSTFARYTDLPYINGCSSKQLINPNRIGDPTWQMLMIPPFTSEQEHHIHSTVRVVYVLAGKGKSHVGSDGHVVNYDLLPGQVILLDKMIPHHFSTEDSELIVLPLHVFSSTLDEHNHPMFNGTYRT